MKTRVLVWFSWKNLWAHRLRTFLTIGGVSIGVASIVFLVSIGYGLEKLVTNQVANFEAFTILDVPSANLKTGKINEEAVTRVQKVSHIVSIDRVVDLAGRVRLSSQDSTTETVAVGADPNYFKLSEIGASGGQFFVKDSKDEVVINQALAGLLGYGSNPNDSIGKKINIELIVPRDLRAADTVEGPVSKTLSDLKVVGTTADDQSPVVFLPLGLVQSQGVINNTSLKIKIDDKKYVNEVRKGIENTGFSTEYVGDTVDQIAQVFVLFRIILGGFGLIALLVAGLGTFNTLTISLMERFREIGLLKTLGMKKKGVFKVFIAESITIGVVGGFMGLFLGSLVGWALNTLLRVLAERAGADPVVIYSSPPLFIAIVSVGSLLVGFFTGFYPAYRAIKTNALDALRYE